MASNEQKKTSTDGWDAWQSEMMRQTKADYIPVASGLRCLYDSLRDEKFTSYQALELCKAWLQALLMRPTSEGGKK